jgi:hypothetical protein
VGDVGERTEQASALLPVVLVMFCSWLKRQLKFGAGESEGWCLQVELVQEMEAEGRREDL